MIGYFVSDQQSDYYKSQIVLWLSCILFKNTVRFKIKEKDQERPAIVVDFDNVIDQKGIGNDGITCW
jgi:hypothetical protein